METLRRFAYNTRSAAYSIVPANFFAGTVLPFAAAFLLGTFRIPSSAFGSGRTFALPPFALAFIDAVWVSSKKEKRVSGSLIACGLGVVLGCLAAENYTGAAAAALLLLAAILLSYRTEIENVHRHAVLLAVLLIMLPAGILLRTWREFTPGTVYVHLIGCGVTMLSALIASSALYAMGCIRLRKSVSDGLLAAIAVLAGMIAVAFGTARPLGISLGAAFTALFCMAAAHAKGIAAVALGAVAAVMRVLGTSGDLLLIAVLCTCTLSACLLRGLGKWGTAVGFSIPAIVFYAAVHGTGTLKIQEILLASAVFMLLPQRVTEPTDRQAGNSRSEKLQERLLYQNYKLTTLSDVLNRLAGLFESGGQPADGFINRQLAGVADSLARLSDQSEGPNIRTRGALKLEFGTACIAKKGFDETGDSVVIRDFDGRYLAAMSDGMGNGASARRESMQTVELLADLVTCGFHLTEAAECVNKLLLLREGGEMYATLDAILLDPVSGELSIAKHGAPPSYIIRKGLVSVLYAEALPVGIIESAVPAVCSFRLRRGDTVVMLSDGAADAFGDSLETALLENAQSGGAELSAKLIAELASRLSGGADDASVIVIHAD